MAKYSKGINGPFSGKVGRVVGTTWMGMSVMRGVPQTRTKPFSENELNQQARFALMSEFLKPLISFLNITFKPVAVRMTGFNKAYSYNVKNAITGFSPDLAIDYSMVLVGRGDLPNIDSPGVSSPAAGKVEFTWTDNSGKGRAVAGDMVFVLVYCAGAKQPWAVMKNATLRSTGSFIMDLSQFTGNEVQTYIGLISADGKDVSESLYAGIVSL